MAGRAPVTGGDPFSPRAVGGAYDAVAGEYGRRFGDDLDRLPVDRAMLDAAWRAAPGRDTEGGWVLEAGCGPAPAATYLAGRAARRVGIDLSAGMLGVARAKNPGLPLARADMRRVPLRDGCCAVVIAYYSLQHLPRTDLVATLAEFGRVLAPGGVLLAATHLGEGDVVTGEFLGHRVDPVGGALHSRDEFAGALTAAGFRIEETRERDPLPHEHDTRRIYVLCRVIR
jgi:SAM-dependent methyltransferase